VNITPAWRQFFIFLTFYPSWSATHTSTYKLKVSKRATSQAPTARALVTRSTARRTHRRAFPDETVCGQHIPSTGNPHGTRTQAKVIQKCSPQWAPSGCPRSWVDGGAAGSARSAAHHAKPCRCTPPPATVDRTRAAAVGTGLCTRSPPRTVIAAPRQGRGCHTCQRDTRVLKCGDTNAKLEPSSLPPTTGNDCGGRDGTP